MGEIWWVFLPFFLIFFKNQAVRQVCPQCGAQLGGPGQSGERDGRARFAIAAFSGVMAILTIFLAGLTILNASNPMAVPPPRTAPMVAPDPRP